MIPYGYDQTTNTLVRIDGNSVITQLTRPAGLPAAGYNTGTLTPPAFFYLYINNTARFYTVDLRPSSPPFETGGSAGRLCRTDRQLRHAPVRCGQYQRLGLRPIRRQFVRRAARRRSDPRRPPPPDRSRPFPPLLPTPMPPSAQWSSTAQARSTPLPTMTERSTAIPTAAIPPRAFPFPLRFCLLQRRGDLSPFCGAAYRRLTGIQNRRASTGHCRTAPDLFHPKCQQRAGYRPGRRAHRCSAGAAFSFRNTPSTAAPPGSLGPVRSRWATSQPGPVSLCCSGAWWTLRHRLHFQYRLSILLYL